MNNSIDIRTEKANAIFRYHHNLQNFTTLFRFVEICVFLVLISIIIIQLPPPLFSVADYVIRVFSSTGSNPRFVFVIGNIIILTLFYKSRVPQNGDPYRKFDLYDDYVRRFEKNAGKSARLTGQGHRKLTSSVTERRIMKNLECLDGDKPSPSPSPEICSEKVMTVENDGQSHRRVTSSSVNVRSPEICRSQSNSKMMSVKNTNGESYRNVTSSCESYGRVTSSVTERKCLKNVLSSDNKMMSVKKVNGQSYRRVTSSVTERKCLENVGEISRSESDDKMMRSVKKVNGQSYRRVTSSVTERKCLENVGEIISRSQSEKMMRVVEYNDGQSQRERREVDELSNEAFRLTVEAFIARQQKCLREEELAPVPYVGASSCMK